MRTAEECYDSHIHGQGCEHDGLVAVSVADIRARDIEVMEEAARLACPNCRREVKKDMMSLHGVEDDHGEAFLTICKSRHIHRRIAELKAEQEKADE